MTMLVPFDSTNLPDVPAKNCPPENWVSGTPLFRSWVLDESLDGRFRSGVWEMTPGELRVMRDGKAEFCYILQGKAVITPNVGEPFSVSEGSAFTLRPGFTGTWRTDETVRKYWVIAS